MRYFLVTLNFIMTIIKLLKLYLNRSYRNKGLPEKLKSLYTKKQYEKWLNYENVTDEFAVKKIVFYFIMNTVLFLSPFYRFLSSLFPQDILLNSLGMMLFMYSIESFLGIIESYYRTFIIEEKFGMNKTTLKIFIKDELIDFCLDLLLMIILILFVHYFYMWFSYYGFIVLFIVIAITIMIIQKNSLYILKLYNQFTPLEDNELKDRINALVDKQGFKLKGIYVMDASKRTKRANAFCLGDKEKEICIDDNMFKYYTNDEILAVFAHELGHAVYNHSSKLKKMNYLKIFILFVMFIVVFLDPSLYKEFGIYQLNYYMVITLLSTFMSLMMFLLEIPSSQCSRLSELEADLFAKKEGYGEELKNILMKLSKNSLSDIMPHPLIVKMLYSHPPLLDRIKNIEEKVI